jgi:hypothetical protein
MNTRSAESERRHYICDYDGVVAAAPNPQVLRALRTRLEQDRNLRLHPQLRMFLRSGFASQSDRFHLECRNLEKKYEDASIKETLSSLAQAASACSGIVIFAAFNGECRARGTKWV